MSRMNLPLFDKDYSQVNNFVICEKIKALGESMMFAQRFTSSCLLQKLWPNPFVGGKKNLFHLTKESFYQYQTWCGAE